MSEYDDKQKRIDAILEDLKPKQKQLADLLFSNTDSMAHVHRVQSLMLNAISDPYFLSRLSAEDWATIYNALTMSDKVKGEFLNEQARLAKDAPPAVQNVYAILANGMLPKQDPRQIEAKKEQDTSAQPFEIPSDILPIQQELQYTLDKRTGIDRRGAMDQLADEHVIDIPPATDKEKPNNDIN